MRAILVDDEEDSIEILKTLLHEHCSDIEVSGTASNALEAVRLITAEKPDLVFLDVQMPGYNGFDVLDAITESTALVIFITAHKDYAISAIRRGAFDYLLKPLDTKELKNCIQRLREKSEKKKISHYGILELAVKEGFIFVKPAEIIRLEASGSYTYFYLTNGIKHLVSRGIKEYEAQLDSGVFYRCHKTHVINLRNVVRFHVKTYCVELSDGSMIEIARRNKEELVEKLKHLQL